MAGIRNNYLSREAYRLRSQGSTAEQILLRLRAYNETRCSPPLPDEELVQIARARSDNTQRQELARLEGFVRFEAPSPAPPQNLRALPQHAANYPLDALGPILAPAARRIHEILKAPAALCGQSLLAAASLAAHAHADVQMDGRRDLLSLFALSIGDLGEGKNFVDRLALKAHHEHEHAALDQHRQEMLAYEIAREAYEAARRLARKGQKDPAAIRSALEALGAAPTPPTGGILIAPAASLEALCKLYASGQANLGVFHEDGEEFLGSQGAADDCRRKSAARLCRLWDAGEIDRIRGSSGADKYFGRRLAMHLMLHPHTAQRVLADEALASQGLLARTLLVSPASMVGERPYVEGDPTADPALVKYHDRIRTLLARKAPLAGPTPGELVPRTLSLEPGARLAWIATHDAIEASQRDGGPLASIRAWASKAPSQILRIAGVLTLIEDPEAQLIRLETIQQANALVQHHLGEASRLLGRTRIPVEVRHAEALRDWCHRQGITHLHSGEALQFGPHSLRTAAIFDAAIEVLERKGWATRIEGAIIGGKKRRRAWMIAGPAHEPAGATWRKASRPELEQIKRR